MKPEVFVSLNEDELRLVLNFIKYRNDSDASEKYKEFQATLGETHLGNKVVQALKKFQ